jgi:hypothetical protein
MVIQVEGLSRHVANLPNYTQNLFYYIVTFAITPGSISHATIQNPPAYHILANYCSV